MRSLRAAEVVLVAVGLEVAAAPVVERGLRPPRPPEAPAVEEAAGEAAVEAVAVLVRPACLGHPRPLAAVPLQEEGAEAETEEAETEPIPTTPKREPSITKDTSCKSWRFLSSLMRLA